MSSVSQFPPPHLIPDEKEESNTINEHRSAPLALPAPEDAATMTTNSLRLNESSQEQDSAVKFDQLGPMIINTDGTISRVHNWSTLTEEEKERTRRILIQRNKARIEKLKK